MEVDPHMRTDSPDESASVNDHVQSECASAEKGSSRTDVSATRQCSSHYDSTTRTARQLTLAVPTRTYDMAEQRKQEKDYTKEVDELLPETRSLAQVCTLPWDACMLLTRVCASQAGKLQDALDKLFAFEKQTRNVRAICLRVSTSNQLCV